MGGNRRVLSALAHAPIRVRPAGASGDDWQEEPIQKQCAEAD